MYLEYCLIANIIICILSILLFLILKKKNQTSSKNSFLLIFCTVIAMICATLIPLIADYLVKEFSFSISEALIVSFFALAAPALVIFYLLMPVCVRQFKNDGEETDDKSDSMNGVIENYSESNDVINETSQQDSAIIKTVEADTYNFETSEKATDSVEPGESAISPEDESERIELPTIEKLEEEEQNVHQAEEIHIVSEEQQISKEEDFSEPNVSEGQEYIESEQEIPVDNSDDQSVITKLLNMAMDSKINRNYQIAITAYERALALDPGDELCYLIILELCSLYKITKNVESVYKLLNSAQCNLLSEDKKEDILRNIKNS